MAEIKRLLVDVGNALRVAGFGKCQHRHVGVKVILRFQQIRRQPGVSEVGRSRSGAWTGGTEAGRSRDLNGAGNNMLHGLLRFDPRPTAAGPAWAGIEGNLQSQSLRLPDGVLEDLTPLWAH